MKMTEINAVNTQSIADYLAQLLKDRKQITAFPNMFMHVERLIDEGKYDLYLSLSFVIVAGLMTIITVIIIIEINNRVPRDRAMQVHRPFSRKRRRSRSLFSFRIRTFRAYSTHRAACRHNNTRYDTMPLVLSLGFRSTIKIFFY